MKPCFAKVALFASLVNFSTMSRAENLSDSTTGIFQTAAGRQTENEPDWMAHVYVFGIGLGLGVGGAVSWKYAQTWTGNFVTLDEGWFGRDTYAGGADKLGHFYTDFVLVRALHEVYSRHGYADNIAILNALLGATTIRTVMEVADGYTSFKFSPQDLTANLLGALSSSFLLAHPKVDNILSVSWTYLPSREKLNGKVDWVSIDNDYNGSVYHLDIRLKGLLSAFDEHPSGTLGDYTVGFSYHTRGYDRKRETKQRMLGLNLSVNIEEVILQHANPDGISYRMHPIFRYYKIPYTFGGVTYDLDNQKMGFRYGLNFFY